MCKLDEFYAANEISSSWNIKIDVVFVYVP